MLLGNGLYFGHIYKLDCWNLSLSHTFYVPNWLQHLGRHKIEGVHVKRREI